MRPQLIRVYYSKDDLIALTKAAAVAHGLPPELVCAVVEQESNWETWSIRYEDAFYHRYVDQSGQSFASTESRARAFSWGLMQVMGQVARELGFTSKLASLCNPETGLDVGCRKLSACVGGASGDLHAALQKWNGGGNPSYADQVLARVDKYK